MKAAQDWSFITKEQGLPKLKPQENRIFHALTAAYSTGQQQEIFGASANIMRHEKEMCEMALEELRRLQADGTKPDETLNLIQEHYQTRLRIASDKEGQLRKLAEDSRKLTEDHKKKTQELAEVKRNLMESQTKLRELAKHTEKLIKKEEELRFIEEGLRKELENNKREMMNGLYEIVVDLEENAPTPNTRNSGSVDVPPAVVTERVEEKTESPLSILSSLPHVPHSEEEAGTLNPAERNPTPAPKATATRIASPAQKTLFDAIAPKSKPAISPTAISGQATIVLASAPVSPSGTLVSAPAPHPVANSLESLLDRSQRARAFEPLKALFNRSLVKTSEGEAICEYFYPVQSSKENRRYVFNSLFTLHALMQVLQRDPTGFHSRLEMVAGDLLSRMDHGRNIAFEDALTVDFNRETLTKLLGLAWKPREQAFMDLAHKVLSRLESLGAMRSKNLEDQFGRWTAGG